MAYIPDNKAMNRIVLKIEHSEAKGLLNPPTELSDQIVVVEGKGILGTPDEVEAIILLSGAILPFITKMVVEAIRNKRRVEIHFKGKQITGLSEDTAKEIIEKLLDVD